MGHEHGHPRGSAGTERTASIEPEYLGMLAFAIFVCMVGKILAAATDLKSENDAFV